MFQRITTSVLVVLLLAFLGAVSYAGQDSDQALIDAARKGNTEEVKKLINKGANVNAKDDILGLTALMWAAGLGYADTVQALLDKGANVNAKGENGQTALMFAARFGQTTTVSALLAKGADVNAKSTEGETALIWAMTLGHSATVKTLLSNGADANVKNKNGETALKLAAKYGHTEIVQMLNMNESALVKFAKFMNTNHTPISLALGILLTFITFKIPKLKIRWKIIIIFFVMLLLTGLTGILKYLGLVLAIIAIWFGGPIAIWILGLVAMVWFSKIYGWNLKWWHKGLIGGILMPISWLLDIVFTLLMVVIIEYLSITYKKLPGRIKRKLETNEPA